MIQRAIDGFTFLRDVSVLKVTVDFRPYRRTSLLPDAAVLKRFPENGSPGTRNI